ncbi:amino acid permease [Mucilaginibacter sp. X5P1]|uniref:amino acid permease n=1 Tax=Mucilaginibacter sp. X5P1 TaxID=2723088 RepID=UPI0016085B38|nr:amino acid permease [Mucilaginibacter sp. X5P1]MBB6140510.1 APA family basic amino acid/polyamine antiporter [Mucilaginibacter sp. X5P1]
MAEPESSKKIGLWTTTSLVVGSMIGAGVFLMPAAMASFGSIGLLGWIFSAIGSFFIAKVFANLSKLLPHGTGGPYAFSQSGLGDFAGFLVAWGYYISNACGNSAIVISFTSALSTFFPVIGTNPLISILISLAAVWLLTYINTLGVVAGGRVQLVTTILKIVPLVLIAVGGLFFIKAKYFLPFNSSGVSVLSAIGTTAAMTMFSYLGIECATIPAGSIENPEKTIGKATILGLLITAVVYILGSVSVMGIIPANTLAHSLTPYADAAVIIYGSNARYWVSAGVAIAAFGSLNGWILVQGQVPYATAKDKLFPPIFGKLNKNGAPFFGIFMNGVLISFFIYMNYNRGLVDQFKSLMLVGVLTTLVPFLFSIAAYPIIRARKKITTGWAAAIILAVLAFSYTLWMVVGSGEDAVFYGFVLLMLGVPFYVWLAYKKHKAAA